MSQYRWYEGLVNEAGFLLQNAAPQYEFQTQGMHKLFGGPTSPRQRDANDPYGLFGSRGSTEAPLCLADFLLEPPRTQYRIDTFVGHGMRKPFFTTNLDESYWEHLQGLYRDQLEALPSAFERKWDVPGVHLCCMVC